MIIGFAVSGSRLGAIAATVRLMSTLVAVSVAALLHNPMARVIEAITPFSEDMSMLVGLLAIGGVTYVATTAIVRWSEHRVSLEWLHRVDRPGGAIAGGLLGVSWANLVLALLVLMPSNSFISRGAVSSRSGAALVDAAPGAMQWLLDAFPHYTQTLPKGKSGAQLRQQPEIPVHEDMPVRSDTEAAGRLLGYINNYRDHEDRVALQWSPSIADVANRHSKGMLLNRSFSTTARDGSKLDDRMRAALGANAGYYDRFVVRIVWAHSVANAYSALIDDRRARRQLLGSTLSEVGIGVADGGWFNGNMYTICMVARRLPDQATGSSTGTAGAATGSPETGAAGVKPASDSPDVSSG